MNNYSKIRFNPYTSKLLSISGNVCSLILHNKTDLTNFIDMFLTFGLIIGGIDTGGNRFVRRSLPFYPLARLEFNRILLQPFFPTQLKKGPLPKGYKLNQFL